MHKNMRSEGLLQVYVLDFQSSILGVHVKFLFEYEKLYRVNKVIEVDMYISTYKSYICVLKIDR